MNIRVCNKCGCVVSADPSEVSEGYAYYCSNCDEDLYGIETHIVDRKVLVRVSMGLSRTIVVDAPDGVEAVEAVRKMLADGEIVISTENGDEDYTNVEFFGRDDAIPAEK